MKKPLLILTVALSSLFAASAFAQKDAPGEGRAVKAVKVEKAAPTDKAAAVQKADVKAAAATKNVAKADQAKPKAAAAEAAKADAVKSVK